MKKDHSEAMISNNESLSMQIGAYEELIKQTISKDTDPMLAKLGLITLWVSDNVLDAIDIDLAPLGISESKLGFLLLFILDQKNEKEASMSPSAIADRLGIERASVTSILDWMEKRGLIIRDHHPQDRRRLIIKITEKGREITFRSLAIFWSSCASLVEEFTKEECRVLEKVLTKMHESTRAKLKKDR